MSDHCVNSDNASFIDQVLPDELDGDDLGDISISEHSDSFDVIETQPSNNDAADKCEIFGFKSKGLHMCNLNVRHILPKIDEIRLTLSNGIPDVLGICESSLETHHPDSLISIDSFNFFRKDKSNMQTKSGGELILYFKQSLNLKGRYDLESSNIETLWAEVTLPKSKPVLICTVYRPTNACSEWIDLFEKEYP